MPTRILLLALLGVLVCAGLVWMFTGNSAAPPSVTEWSAGDEQQPAADDAPPDLLNGEVDSDEPARTELDEVTTPAANDEDRPDVGVRGRVLDPGGRPLPGAAVVLELRRGPEARGNRNTLRREATSAADGTFAFRGPGYTVMSVTVQLSHERFAPMISDHGFEAERGTLDLGDLRLLAGGAVLGSVVATDDTPVAGATVRPLPASGNRLQSSRERASLLPAAITDANGWFKITRLMPGAYRLEVSAPLHERRITEEVLVVDDREEQLEPIRLGAGYRIAGTVFAPDGSRFENAHLRVRAPRNSDQQGLSDAQGRFAIDHIPAETVTLEVRAPGLVTYRLPQLDPRQSGASALTIRLVAGLRITGDVRDARSGQPVTRFAARVRRVGELAEGGGDAQMAELRARIEASGARDDPAIQEIAERETLARIRAMEEAFANDQRSIWGGRTEDLGEVQDRAGGRFEFSALDEGVYIVDIASPDHLRLASDRIELRAGGPPVHVTLAVAAGLAVAGTVVAIADRRPIAKARVELVDTDDRPLPPKTVNLLGNRRSGRPVLQTDSDADGRFAFGHAPPGRYLVRAHAEGHPPTSSEAFALHAPVADLVIALAVNARLIGKVIGIPSGKSDAARVVAFGGVARMRSANVNTDGTFTLDGLEPGDYVARAFVGDSRTFLTEQMRRLSSGEPLSPDLRLGSGETRELTLTAMVMPTGSVRGTVLHNGRPGAGYQLRLEAHVGEPTPATAPGIRPTGRRLGRSLRTSADLQGNFEFAEVPAGDYVLTATGRGGRGVLLVQQPCSVQADLETRAAISVASGNLRGRIVADDGTAADELDGRLQLFAGLTQPPVDPSGSTTDNASHTIRVRDGAFAPIELPVGDYLLVSTMRDRQQTHQQIRVDIDSVTTVEVSAGARRPEQSPPPAGKTPPPR